MNEQQEGVRYGTISESQLTTALAMLVWDEPPQERPSRAAVIVDAVLQSKDAANTLVGANRNGKLVAAAWGQILPGKTALIWPPRLSPSEDDSIGDDLLGFLDAQLQLASIQMAQAVLPDNVNHHAKRFSRAGYTHAADLFYLVSDVAGMDTESTVEELEFVAYQPKNRQRLADIVERTYIDTQDIPALDGVRDIEDVLDGYERTGVFAPELWFFVQHNGSDVGCLLLTDHPEQNQWELVYVGIVPEARGNRGGVAATKFAQHQTRAAGRGRLILAVDATNDPAVNAYTKAGFVELLRRTIYLKIFSTNGS